MHEMARQAEQAIAEADAVIFVVDGRTGITALDKEIANKLRRAERPVFVVVNKAEGMNQGIVIAISMSLAWVSPTPSRRPMARACAR